MFEAARLMKGGVGHIDQLDWSVLEDKTRQLKEEDMPEVKIVEVSKEVVTNKMKQKATARVNFESNELFNPD